MHPHPNQMDTKNTDKTQMDQKYTKNYHEIPQYIRNLLNKYIILKIS